MADEHDKTLAPDGAAADAPAKKGSKKMLFIGVGAVVVGIALALFVIKPMLSSAPEDGHEEAAETHESESHGESDGHGATAEAEEGGGHGSAKGSAHGSKGGDLIYAIQNIVVNPAGTGGSRYLSVSFGFELGNADIKRKLEGREAVIRDALITIMASKTVAQLTDIRQREIARYQIKKRVSELMETDQVVGVYFTDFVLQ